MRVRWAVSIWAFCLAVLLGAGATAALADSPVQLGSARIADSAGILDGSERAMVTDSIDDLASEHGVDLWVVYVPTFTDPSDAEGWANQTAEDNNLGPNQYLLAIATEDRAYYLSGDSSGPVSGDQLTEIEQRLILPQLRDEDWAGAGVAAAQGLGSAVGGGSTGAAGSGGSTGWLTVLLIVVVAVVAVVLLVVFLRRRRVVAGQGPAPTGRAGAPVDPLTTTSIPELERLAGSALVQTDDAVRTSEEELGFATASYGEQATAAFTAALAGAKEQLTQAFALRQRLDDAEPDTEQQQRDWNIEIIRRCEHANHVLDEQAASFDELRALERNAPAAVEELRARTAAAEPAVQTARETVTALQARYTPDALITVLDNPSEAAERLTFATAAVADASARLAAGDSGEAAVGIRAAEEALDQSTQLTGAVKRLQADLTAAEQQVAARIAELDGDVAAAAGQADPTGGLAAAVASTSATVAQVRTALGAANNPIALLARLDAANAQIDGALQEVRTAAEQRQRAVAALGQTLQTAQAQVSAAEDFVVSRRGAVGPEARTRLAEAGRTLVQAQGLAPNDPTQALSLAQRATSLAGQAVQLAQADVGQFQNQSAGGLDGMFGGGGQGGGNGMLGAVLGGILINSVLGGGGGGGSRSGGGMFGGGGGGSRSRSGGGMFGGGGRSRSAGSFGGGGTRSRRGGGRF
ncbi:TPM domain-containing protein [Plantibacter sp. ME-Dv--P-095]|uniref:TPM domain-containing protein n=1 Tax=Plantibacter sp. ME-Dv--P-095 TaxID=3040299 RepID=UPI00254E561D|nr:TPM domain-containing protein [Plantibacter sp. ME-Dv--P-095]